MHELSVEIEEDEGGFSIQTGVFSQIEFSHAAFTDFLSYLVVTDLLPERDFPQSQYR